MDPRQGMRMLKDPMKLRKMQQVRKKRLVEETKKKNEDEGTLVEKVVIDYSESLTQVYTAEQNYLAYKLFSIMDTNSGGSITLREMKRVFLGDTTSTFTAAFDHPDTGVIWGLDVDDCVVVDSCEEHSPAHTNPFLIKGTRIMKINETDIPSYNKGSLQLVYNILLQLHDQQVTFTFLEPHIIISNFSCMLDIEVVGHEYSINIPIGSHYNLDAFVEHVREALVKTHKAFKYLDFNIVEETRKVTFKSEKYEFRLLFKTGSNAARSARYALGFNAEDTVSAYEHEGQSMLIKLDLGISRDKLETLLEELFLAFDKDGSGEFEYEEFRNFFVKFMYTEECRQLLKKYAAYRFRDVAREAAIMERLDHERVRKDRQKRLRVRNKAVKEMQKQKDLANSRVGEDGVRRRVYAHKREDQICIRRPRSPSPPKIKPSFDPESDPLAEPPPSPEKEAHEYVGMSEERKLQLAEERELQKEHMRKLADQRKIVLQRIFEANKRLNVENKRDAKKVEEAERRLHMLEVCQALKKNIRNAFTITTNKTIKGMSNVVMKLAQVIASPALQISPKIFSLKEGDIDLDDIDLVEIPADKMNPATVGYFLLREPKVENYMVRESTKRNTNYDPSIKHPAFFTADYERKSSRHSDLALNVVRQIEKQRAEGVKYRLDNGIEYFGNKVPVDEVYVRPPKVTKVKFENPKQIILNGLIGRATAKTISVTDLPPAHVLEKNSPFVTVKCGDYQVSSEINAFAGANSEWGDLTWTFRLYTKHDLVITVSSGSVIRNEVIGSAIISTDDFMQLPITKYGDLHFMSPIKNLRTGVTMGQISINFFVEVGGEFDWYAFAFHRRRKENIKIRKMKKLLLAKANAEITEMVQFPLKIDINCIYLYELINAHLLVKNSPQVFVDCGNFNQQTDVKEASGDVAEWKDLNWSFDMHSERSNIVFIVSSGSATIGRFAINGEAIANLPRRRSGKIDIIGTLIAPSGQTGKITVEVKIYCTPVGVNTMGSFELSSSESIATGVRTVNSFLAKTFPAKVNIITAGVLDLPSVHQSTLAALAGTAQPNSPYFTIKCGASERISPVMFKAGSECDWDELDISFPMSDRLSLTISVYSQYQSTSILLLSPSPPSSPNSSTSLPLSPDKDTSKDVYIGSVTIDAVEFATMHQDSNGNYELVKFLVDGVAVVGTLKMLFRLSQETEGALLTYFPEETQALVMKQESISSPITGYGSMSFTVNSVTEATKEAAPNKILYLPMSSLGEAPTSIPFRMTISSIVAVDLASVHILSKNSPHINAACGTWAAITPTLKNTNIATWNALGWSFFVHEKTFLRLTVWSNDKVIGAIALSCDELLETSVDVSSGVSEIFTNILEGNKTRGRLHITFIKEKLNTDPVEDPNYYKIDEVNLEPPLLVTVYTLAVMDLRAVHPFSRNHPSLKATCGKWKDSTNAIINGGSDAKWEDVMWGVTMAKDTSEYKVVVMSDSIVIGYIVWKAIDLTSQPIDKHGLTQVEGYLTDGKNIKTTGRIRMVCRLEAHPDTFDSDESQETDDDFKYEFDQERSILGLPKSYIPRKTRITFVGILAFNLEIATNSTIGFHRPFVAVEYEKKTMKTRAQFIKENKVKWTDFDPDEWTLTVKRQMILRFTVASRTMLGTTSFNIRDLYNSPRDDAGLTMVKKSLNVDGYYSGEINVQLKLEEITDNDDDDDELDEALFFYDPLSIPYNPKLRIDIPYVIRVAHIKLIDLVPFHTIGANSPAVEIKVGDFTKITSAWESIGANCEWQDVGWSFLVLSEDHKFKVTAVSRKRKGGVLELSAREILSVPRTAAGVTVITGSLLQGKVAVGKVTLYCKVANYVTPEEQERIRLEAEELRRPPRLIAKFSILSILVEGMTQIYGLFKNSPRVLIKFGAYENTTDVVWGAGENCAWEELNWINIPVKERSECVLKVYSSNELVGQIVLKAEDIVRLEQDEFGYTTIFGDLIDGIICKGKISIGAKVDYIDTTVAQSVDDASSFISAFQTVSTLGNDTSLVQAGGEETQPQDKVNSMEEEVVQRTDPYRTRLSMATPTPVMTKAFIMDLTLTELRNVHSFGKSSPLVKFQCGNWKSSTQQQSGINDTCTWSNLAVPFVMKKMTFVHMTVFSKTVYVGSVSISTREMLEVPKDERGYVTLQRNVENDSGEIVARMKLQMTIETIIGDVEYAGREDDDAMSQSQASMSLFGKDNSITTPINIELPCTVSVFKILVLDLPPLHTFSANSPYVHIACGESKKKTAVMNRAGANAEWPSLDWTFNVFNDKVKFQIVVHSSSVLAGSMTLTIPELTSIPPNRDGATVIEGLIKKDNSIRGRIQVYTTIRPYRSHEVTERAKLVDAPPLKTPRLIGMLQISLLVVAEFSLLTPSLNLKVTLDTWSGKTSDSLLKSGIGAFGNLEWDAFPVRERATLTVKAFYVDGLQGVFTISAEDLFSIPRERDGTFAVHGPFLGIDGLCKGKVSISCKADFQHESNDLNAGSSMLKDNPSSSLFSDNQLQEAPQASSVSNDLLLSNGLRVPPSTFLILQEIHTAELRSVHSNSFNSPLVRVECGATRLTTKAIPYGGDAGIWSDLSWSFAMRARGYIKVSVMSGSALIGTVTVSTRELWEAPKVSANADWSVLVRKLVRRHQKPTPTAQTFLVESEDDLLKKESMLSDDQEPCGIVQLVFMLQYGQVGDAEPDASFVQGSTSLLSPENESAEWIQMPSMDTNDLGSPVMQLDTVSLLTKGTFEYKDVSDAESNQDDDNRSETSEYSTSSSASYASGSSYYSASSRPKTSRTRDDSDAESRRSSAGSVPSLGSLQSAKSNASWLSGSEYGKSEVSTARSELSTARSDYSDVSNNSADSASTGTSRRSSKESLYSDEESANDEDSVHSMKSVRTASSAASAVSDLDEEPNIRIPSRNEQSSRWLSATKVYGSSMAAPRPALQSSDYKILQDGGSMFDVSPLTYLPAHASQLEVSKSLAYQTVDIVFNTVVSSLLAVSAGTGFTLNGVTSAIVNGNNRRIYRGQISIPELAFHTVQSAVAVAGTRALRFLLGGISVAEPSVSDSADDIAAPAASFKKRAGLLVGNQGFVDYNQIVNSISSSIDESELEGFELFPSAVAGLGPVPMRARITFIDFIGFDMSFMDRRVLPKRPYLTACKPYGNWGHDTRPMWISDRNISKKDMVLNWYDLPNRENWTPCVSRLGNAIVFDLHDGGSGLIFAKLALLYEYILNQPRDKDDNVSLFAKFDVANEYGGGAISGVIRMSIDLSANVWIRPPKPVEYWDKLTIHHWRTYPIPPVCTGVVRHNYADLAKEYDAQRIVNPIFFGFCIRYRGHQRDESRFVNPIFQGFTYAKKVLTKAEADKIAGQLMREKDPNPFKWDPFAAKKGRCFVCGDGQDGCPRCWMLPANKQQGQTALETFAFDPEKEKLEEYERQQAARREAELLAVFERKKKNFLSSGRMKDLAVLEEEERKRLLKAKGEWNEYVEEDDDDDGSTTASGKRNSGGPSLKLDEPVLPLKIHTNLTTYDAVYMYRKACMKLMTVFVKVLPSGVCVKLYMDPTWTTFHLYCMFNAHCDLAFNRLNRLAVITDIGLFPISGNISHKTEHQIADYSGRDTLARYGMKVGGATYVLFYFRNFDDDRSPHLVTTFFEKNANIPAPFQPIRHALSDLPANLRKDRLQRDLRITMRRQYYDQQLELKNSYINRGIEIRRSQDDYSKKMAAERKLARLEAEKAVRAAERRMESELAKFPEGEQREKMRKILEEREMAKRGHVSEEDMRIAMKKQAEYKKRMARLQAKRSGQSVSDTSTGVDEDTVKSDLGDDEIKGGEEEEEEEDDDDFYEQEYSSDEGYDSWSDGEEELGSEDEQEDDRSSVSSGAASRASSGAVSRSSSVSSNSDFDRQLLSSRQSDYTQESALTDRSDRPPSGGSRQGTPDAFDQQMLFDNYVEERGDAVPANAYNEVERPHTTDTNVTEHTFDSIPTQKSAETIDSGRSSKSNFSAIIPRIDTGRSGSTLRSFDDADDYGDETGRTRTPYSRTDYGGDTYRSRSDYGDETGRTRTPYSRTDYGGDTARSRTDYGDETARSRTDYGGDTARSRTDYGGDTYRSRTDYGGETARSRTGYGGETARSRNDYGGDTARSRTDYGGDTYRSRTDYGGDTYRSRTDYGGDTYRSRTDYGGETARSRTGYGGDTARSHTDYGGDTYRSRTDYGGETARSRTDYGGETARSRTDFGGDTARSRTDYGGDTYRSRTDYGDETARSRTDYGGDTARSRTDYGGETARSRTDGGDTARSKPASTIRSFDDEPASYPDTSTSKQQSKPRSFDDEPASYEENKVSGASTSALPLDDAKSLASKSVKSTQSSMKSSVNTSLVPSLTFDETPEVMKEGYLTLKDVKNVNDFRTYAQRRREEVVQAAVGLPDSGGKSTYRDSVSSFSGHSTDYTPDGSNRSRTPRSANYSDSDYSRKSDTYSDYSATDYSATDYSPRSTYRSKYSGDNTGRDDRIQTATTDTYTRTYTGSTYTRTYTGSTDSRGRGGSDYSMTPRSQLPYGEDFERLPTDRSDFSYHSSAYDEKQETKTSSSNDNDSSKVTIDRSKQYRQIGKPVTVRVGDGTNSQSNSTPNSANSNSISARAQRHYSQSSNLAGEGDVKLPHITKK